VNLPSEFRYDSCSLTIIFSLYSLRRILRAFVVVGLISLIAPVTSLFPQPASADIPIPDLAVWETWMVGSASQGGTHWCNSLPSSWTGDESEAWYYDDERVFYQISDYVTTNKTFWDTCAQKSENLYRPYVIANNGRVDGWRVFPHGLYMDYVGTGDTTSRSAALMLANGLRSADNAALWTENGIPAVDHFTYTRELSSALNSQTVAEELGQTHRAWGDRLADGLLKHQDQWFTTKNSADIKFFMVGLNMEALIGWYELHPDPRIPPAIQAPLDGIWTHWNAPGKYFPYCYTRPGGALGSPASDCGDDYGSGNRVVNNLIGHAYGWYYQYSGNTLYRDRGDQVFSGAA
jgi:hypothetical protein